MNKTDLIPVIIPTYNRAHLIKRSVESVLNQTYKNLELIIVDDGSTDNTKEVIDSINDGRIVYIKQENQGACAARNHGIDIAKGEYIAFHDSDDVWHLDKLEKQLNTLKQHNADVVSCKMFVFGNLIKRIWPKNFKEGFLQNHSLPLGISTQTLIGKTEIFLNNKFDLEMPRFQEFELLLRIQKKHSIYCIDKPLFDYYVQKDSISRNPEKILKAWEIILERNKDFLTKYSSSLEYLASCNIDEAFKIKDFSIRKQMLDIVFMFSKSKKIKIKYFLHKIYFYKLKTLLYKTASKTIKKVITILR